MEPCTEHSPLCYAGCMRTRSLNHSTYQIQYHLVWGTRYRRKYLKEYVIPELKRALYAVVKTYPTLYVHKLATVQDHLHMQIEIPPNIAVAAVVQKLKISTSIHLKKRFKFIREMYLDSSIWSVGYYVSTLGLNEEAVKQYLDRQGRLDRGRTLRLPFA